MTAGVPRASAAGLQSFAVGYLGSLSIKEPKSHVAVEEAVVKANVKYTNHKQSDLEIHDKKIVIRKQFTEVILFKVSFEKIISVFIHDKLGIQSGCSITYSSQQDGVHGIVVFTSEAAKALYKFLQQALATWAKTQYPGKARRRSSNSDVFKETSIQALFLGKTVVLKPKDSKTTKQATRAILDRHFQPQKVILKVGKDHLVMTAVGKRETILKVPWKEVTYALSSTTELRRLSFVTTDEYNISLCYVLQCTQPAKEVEQILLDSVKFTLALADKDRASRLAEHTKEHARRRSVKMGTPAVSASAKPKPSASSIGKPASPTPEPVPPAPPPDAGKIIGVFEGIYLGSMLAKQITGPTAIYNAFEKFAAREDLNADLNIPTQLKNIPVRVAISAEAIRTVGIAFEKEIVNTQTASVTCVGHLTENKTLDLLESLHSKRDACVFGYVAVDERLQRRHCELYSFKITEGEQLQDKFNEASRLAAHIEELRKKVNPFAAYSSTRENASSTLFRHQIHRADLTAVKVIGMGQFGEVYLAKHKVTRNGKPIQVRRAVKVLKGSANTADKSDFLHESETMLQLKHPNLVDLVGVAVQQRPWLAVMEYIEYGDLLNFVKTCKLKGMMVTDAEHAHIAKQICAGMSHLEKLKFIHMDLAARNVLLAGNTVCKVADFGLTRKVDPVSLVYRQTITLKLPVKWLAVECLKYRMFSSKSDVWAFGVMMWEITSYGGLPYPNVKNVDVQDAITKQGIRLEQPRTCHIGLFELLTTCWMEKPKDRPSFSQLCAFFDRLIEKFARHGQKADRDLGHSLKIFDPRESTKNPAYISQSRRSSTPSIEGYMPNGRRNSKDSVDSEPPSRLSSNGGAQKKPTKSATSANQPQPKKSQPQDEMANIWKKYKMAAQTDEMQQPNKQPSTRNKQNAAVINWEKYNNSKIQSSIEPIPKAMAKPKPKLVNLDAHTSQPPPKTAGPKKKMFRMEDVRNETNQENKQKPQGHNSKSAVKQGNVKKLVHFMGAEQPKTTTKKTTPHRKVKTIDLTAGKQTDEERPRPLVSEAKQQMKRGSVKNALSFLQQKQKEADDSQRAKEDIKRRALVRKTSTKTAQLIQSLAAKSALTTSQVQKAEKKDIKETDSMDDFDLNIFENTDTNTSRGQSQSPVSPSKQEMKPHHSLTPPKAETSSAKSATPSEQSTKPVASPTVSPSKSPPPRTVQPGTSSPTSPSRAPLSPENKQLLQACKDGNPDAISDALSLGAHPGLGLSFMFKVIHLYDRNIAMNMVSRLKAAKLKMDAQQS
eukprot:m.37383 g.37383  ORF g.37383 m.37383 type:complete len:1282 (+) comp9309_c0_seq1:436-4281(+)